MKSIRDTVKGIKKNSITPIEVKEVATIMLMILNSKKRRFYYSEIQSFADKYKKYSLYINSNENNRSNSKTTL